MKNEIYVDGGRITNNQKETVKCLIEEARVILDKEIIEPEPDIVMSPMAAGERYLKWKAKMKLFEKTLPIEHPFKKEIEEKIDDPDIYSIKEIKAMLESIMEWYNKG